MPAVLDLITAISYARKHATLPVKSIFDDECNKEWASLPGDVYGQGGVDMGVVVEKFSRYLGDELAGKSDLSVAVGGLDDIINN